jgi:hypothetical protein
VLRHTGVGDCAWRGRLGGCAAYLDYVLLPALAVCLGLIGYGLYLRRQAATVAETGEKRNV